MDIAAGVGGTVWIGTLYSGLVHYTPGDGGNWFQYTKEQMGLDSGSIISVECQQDKIWFVTGYEPSVPGNGTGVHRMTLAPDKTPSVTSYTHMGSSTTLTTNRFNSITADKSGNIWFPAYNDASIARLKPDGTWQQFRSSAGGQNFDAFNGVYTATDSANIVYFAPLRQQPFAFDADTETWIDLPDMPVSDRYYYGIYVDQNDGKWFYGAFGAYFLNADNTSWTLYSGTEMPAFADEYVEHLIVDTAGNVWFSTRYGLTLQKLSGDR
ncbi:hypothetical protein [Desulfobacula sp.]|uniref:hypothetical protein n=1 Tax=Desulfobacula sp. TaxID=2593537 RepID=UPI00262EC200|nr:hypothetical protein [Desulfobacula sp.]